MEVNELKEKMRDYASSKGYKLNPDEQAVDRLLNGMLAKKKEYGGLYCPCRRVTEDEEENKRIVCPCAYHEQEIQRDGKCFCGLFVRG
jgi:ferredoxin-thioredoxin reductase catalytic subunit